MKFAKSDENALYVKLLERDRIPVEDRPFADFYFEEVGISQKRGEYILKKWADKGIWNYGVSLRSGWLEK